MLSDGNYARAERKENESPLNAQEFLYDEAYRRLEEKQAKQERMRENREKSSPKSAKTKGKSSKNKK